MRFLIANWIGLLGKVAEKQKPWGNAPLNRVVDKPLRLLTWGELVQIPFHN
jgi:hypothetical protein